MMINPGREDREYDPGRLRKQFSDGCILYLKLCCDSTVIQFMSLSFSLSMLFESRMKINNVLHVCVYFEYNCRGMLRN